MQRLECPQPEGSTPNSGGKLIRLVHITTIAATQYTFLNGQNDYMRSRGFEVHAIATPSARLLDLARRDGVSVHGIQISRTVAPLADMVSLWRLYRCLRQIQPTLVVLGTPKAALIGAIAAWLARSPIRVFMFHGSISETATGMTRVLYWLAERLTVSLCHRVICVSNSLLESVRERGVLGRAKATVLLNGMCNGVDAERFDPDRGGVREEAGALRRRIGLPENATVIGYVGALARDKGIDDLSVAWQRIRELDPSLHLLLVGSWESGDPISSETRRCLEEDPRVHLLGHVDDVVPCYGAMDIFVCPSRREGFSTVCMEAAAMRLPVVVFSVTGCVDAVVHTKTGTVVPPRDIDAFAAAIERYIHQPALRREHGAAGRSRVVSGFRPQEIWEATYLEYLQLVRSRGLGGTTNRSG